MDQTELLLSCIRETIVPSTGCTEPVAIALCSATARAHAPGEIRKAELVLDLGLLKNAMGVGIPGLDKRGVALCCALGLVDGDPANGMDILGKIPQVHREEIERIAPLVEVSAREDIATLFIQLTLTTDQACVRVTTTDRHDHIAAVETPPFAEILPAAAGETDAPPIQRCTLHDMVRFADEVPLERIEFLWEGVEMNRRMSEAGLQKGFWKGAALLEGEALLPAVQRTVGAASYARMSGVTLPTMTATGSGNQGITVFLTVDTVCQKLGIGRERELRALALANAVNVYAKSFLGALSPICACGVASGLGAGVGIVYALGGTEAQMFGAMKNMLGGVSGMICDGAKEGCSSKVSIGAGCAVVAAMTALEDQTLASDSGILGRNMEELYCHLRALVCGGMASANRVMVDVMLDRQREGT